MANRKKPEDRDADPKDSSFHTLAMSRWRSADTAEGGGVGSMRFEGQIDLQFLNLEQWDPDIVRDRGNDRPCLTIDQIGEPYRQMVGQQRQARPAIQINPVDNGADIETAEVFQGLIRHIEVTGGAKAARDEAFKGEVGPGWGYYRLLTKFEYDQDGPIGPHLFDQCITYQPIENQFSVFRDPACPLLEPQKARFTFIVEDVPTEQFKEQWPNAKATSAEAFAATGLTLPDWYPENSVRVADYFYVEEKDGPEVCLLANGQVCEFKDAPADVAILQRRTPKIRTVRLAKITGAEILEGADPGPDGVITEGREQPWPAIPVVPLYGESLVVNGKRTVRGMVRAARDAQRSYNYQVSELVYELALSPKSKVMMPGRAMEGYEQQWKDAATTAFSALLWNDIDPTTSQPIAPPAVAHFTDSTKIQAVTVAINQFKADLRSTLSFYDPSDPSRKNTDQSGRAILARKEAMDQGAVNYKDNFGLGLLFEGYLLVGAIPKIYNRIDRILRLLGEDGKPEKPVTVGGPFKKKQQQGGIAGVFAWGAGRYDLTVSIGTSYQTRRQEASDTQLKLVEVLAQVNPQMAAAIVPDAIRNMDIPGSQQLADRAERALPPEMRDDEDGEDDPQALKAQLSQMQQQKQQDGQVIQGLQEAIKTDAVKQQATIAKERIAFQKEIALQRMKDATTIAVAKINALTKGLVSANEAEVEAIALAHEAEQADLDREHQASMSAADQEHQQFMSDHGHEQTLEQNAQQAALQPPQGGVGV